MSWVKIDDRMPEHPKVFGLSDRAFRAHVEALCYCAGILSDGLVPTVIAKGRRWARSAGELVTAGLWEVDERGWMIHDYLKHQRSKESADRLSETRAAVGALGGQAKAIAKQTASKLVSKPLANPATRSEEIRSEDPNPTDSVGNARVRAKPKPEPFTDEHRAKMHERYAERATPSEVDEQIDLALAHKAARNTTRLDLYVNNWLRRSFEGRNGTSAGRGQSAGGGGYAGNGRGPVGSVRGGGDSVVRGAFPVAKPWPPASNE